MRSRPEKRHIFSRVSMQSYGLLLFAATISACMSFLLYKQTEHILEDRLKEKLIGVVSTASLIFTPSELEQIADATAVGTPAYESTVRKLQAVRTHNKNLKYAYILRTTDDPDVYTYVADADSLYPDARVDLNADGVLNEEDALATPGDSYDVSAIPALRNDARTAAVTDVQPVSDQWGNFLSAYAPIMQDGEDVLILGIDVEVSNYLQLIQQTLIPFAIFVCFLFILLTLMTITLVNVWNTQVRLMQELDRQKDELLGIVAHQLATPITSLKWYTEMLIDGDLGTISEEQKKHLDAMHEMGGNLTDLVGMILDVSRIQLGRIKVEKQTLDLEQFFKEILDVIEPKAAEKKMHFKKTLPHTFPQALLDKRYTRMTIENLLTNAVKYTPEGGDVRLIVEIRNRTLFCTVQDTGMGIPQSEQGKIFGKMFRASNARNSVDGNGFGLYVAKGAIEAQGGTITFVSEEGKGTTFSVTLPLA